MHATLRFPRAFTPREFRRPTSVGDASPPARGAFSLDGVPPAPRRTASSAQPRYSLSRTRPSTAHADYTLPIPCAQHSHPTPSSPFPPRAESIAAAVSRPRAPLRRNLSPSSTSARSTAPGVSSRRHTRPELLPGEPDGAPSLATSSSFTP